MDTGAIFVNGTICLNTAAKYIHAVNVSKGFWPDDVKERNVGEALALIHSELSEAYEAYVDDLMDDKLTQYPGVVVEIADALIRVLDLGGAFGVTFGHVVIDPNLYSSVDTDVAVAHKLTSDVLESHRKGGDLAGLQPLAMNLVGLLFKYGYDLYVVMEKVTFNEGRPFKHGKSY